MAAASTYPVRVLRDHATALEAALSVCLAEPGHKPVHRLRTETRRMEAELLLLEQLPEVPEHHAEADILLKELKRLRRAAGKVRDLDVHRKLLEEYVDSESDAAHSSNSGAEGANAPHPGAAKRGSKARQSHQNGPQIKAGGDASGPALTARQREASDLRSHMGKQRDAAATKLQKLLKKRQTKIAAALETMLKCVQEAENLPVAEADLMRHAQGVLERDGLLRRGDVSELSRDELHTVRKAAKAARYLAETLPDSTVATRTAQRFEAMQEAGGQWHDLLEIAQEARRFLGKNQELTVTLASERDRKLEQYRQMLVPEQKNGAAAAGSKRPSAKRRARSGAKPSAVRTRQ